MTARRPRARAVATALLLALATALGGSLPPLEPVTAPVARTLPAPIRDALRPLPVFAGTPCSNYSADYPKFTGRLSNSSGTLLTETTTGTVYGRISNVDQSWDLYDCYAYRYDAVLWATTDATTNLRVNWGLLAGDGNACRYNVGTTDYLHANSGACPGSETTARLVVSLTPQATYRADVNLDHTGDFAFAHADCSTNYGAEPIKTGASTSVTSGKPGANCGNKALDGTGTSQTLVYDGTAPTISFTFPAAGGPAALASTSAAVTFSATDNVAGFGGSDDWDLTRQTATWNGTACGTFAADTGPKAVVSGTTAGTQVVGQGLAAGACYRWTLGARDQNGNTATTITSGTVRTAPPPATLGLPAWGTVETLDLGAGDSLAVNVGTGNLVVSHPVVSLPIRGGTLELAATYNSADSTNVGMGPGWRLDVFRRLAVNADGSVTFTAGDGSRHTFTDPQGSGTLTYTRPPTLHATLVRDTAATPDRFTLTWRDQSVDVFDEDLSATGLLKQQKDRHGNTVTFAYAAGTARISTITDPAGRSISFTWDGSGRLTQIVDWANVSGGIVQGSGTGNRTHRFLYDGSGYLAGWADPLAGGTPACPAGGSHLTCLAYTGGLLSAITRTQTYATFDGSALGTATRPVTTSVAYENADVAGVTDAEGAQVTFSHPAAGVTRVARPGTPASQTTYALTAVGDPHARVGSVKRKLGAAEVETTTTYDASYPIEPAAVTENKGGGALERTTSYTYQASSPGLLARLDEPLDGTYRRWTDYTYNANNDVTQTVVSRGGDALLRTTTRTCYDASCTLTGAMPLLVLRTVENYVDGTAGGTNGHTDDVTTTYQYDGYGQRTRATRSNYAAGGTLLDQAATGWTYDAYGNVTSEIRNYTDGLVDTTGGDFDIDPGPTTNARTDLTTAYGHDTAGNRTSSADPRRAIEAAKGTTLGSDDYVSRTTYDALGQIVTTRLPTTPVALGGADCSPSPGCRETATEYDELGLVRTSADINDLVTATLYDRAGRSLETYEDPPAAAAAKTSVSTYDAQGRLLTAKNREQAEPGATLGSTTYTYDELGRQLTITEAAGSSPDAASVTTSAYDNLDRRTSETVGGIQTTTWTYDLGDRVTRVDDEFTCTSTTYDWRGLATAVAEGLDPGTCGGTALRTITHSHDALGRLTRSEITAGQGAGDVLAAPTYDAAGNTRSTSATRAGATTGSTFTVNPLDETVAETRSDGGTATSWTKTNVDPAGTPTDRCAWNTNPGVELCKAVGSTFTTTPAVHTTTGYDARNQRVSLAIPGVSETTYDPAHEYRVKAVYVPTGTGKEHQALYGYDGRHRLTSITQQLCTLDGGTPGDPHDCSATVATGSDTYEYDDNDSRTRVSEANGAGSLDRHYCHDALDRLVSTRSAAGCSSGLLEAYEYDAAGNRTRATLASPQYFRYSGAGQLCEQSASAGSCPADPATWAIRYDDAGRTSAWNGWTLTYDGEGRLASACKVAGCASGDMVTMRYDGDGRRVELVTRPDGGAATTTAFRYQGSAIAQELTGTGTLTLVRTYVTDEAGTIIKVCDPDCTGTNPAYLVTHNGHGDALALWRIEASGSLTLANSYTYSTWGAPTTATHNGYGDLGFRYLYVGPQGVAWDNALGLGLLHMGARHYSPTLGRFLQPDPSAAEANLYAYGANSPVSRVDPSGWESEVMWCFLNPAACLDARQLAPWLVRETVRRWGAFSAQDGRGDAWRHCTWIGCIAALYGVRTGRALGDAHEESNPNRPEVDRMDRHNNRVGAMIGGWYREYAFSLGGAARARALIRARRNIDAMCTAAVYLRWLRWLHP